MENYALKPCGKQKVYLFGNLSKPSRSLGIEEFTRKTMI